MILHSILSDTSSQFNSKVVQWRRVQCGKTTPSMFTATRTSSQMTPTATVTTLSSWVRKDARPHDASLASGRSSTHITAYEFSHRCMLSVDAPHGHVPTSSAKSTHWSPKTLMSIYTVFQLCDPWSNSASRGSVVSPKLALPLLVQSPNYGARCS